jgi:hypothetical protein
MPTLQAGIYLFEECCIEDERGVEELQVCGCIIYTSNGFMAVQIRWGDGRIASYFGPFSIQDSLVFHHVDQGADVAGTMANPSTQIRKFEILPDGRLKLQTIQPVTIDGRRGNVELTARLIEAL